ncbi:MAG: ABC transporter permease, partial [Firmicutes bacterium]|nr:ABC transporter permease [Bacillota bacterium]
MKYVLKKFITLLITLFVISLLTFTAFSVIPGDAALSKLGIDASPEAIAELQQQYGLDKPILERYVDWAIHALQGDFGQSFNYTRMTVSELLSTRLPVTVILAAMSLLIIVLVSVPLGMLSAKFSGRWPDVLINQT